MAADWKKKHRHTEHHLLEGLRKRFSSMGPVSTLLHRNDLVIENRLLRVTTPEEFATQDWFDVKYNVFSSVVSECSSMRLKAGRSTALHREQAGIHALCCSCFISGSFGREVSKSKSKIDRSHHFVQLHMANDSPSRPMDVRPKSTMEAFAHR